MNVSDTLSVDPGRTTLGDLHPELDSKFSRRKRMVGMRRKRSAKKVLNFIFAINALRADGKAMAMLLIRWALGALLIVSGSFILSGEISSPVEYLGTDIIAVFAILEIVVGTMLVFGIFTRFAMGVATIGFVTVSIIATCKGIFDMQSFMSAISCLVFLVFGSGKYSADFLLRKAIIQHNNRRRRKKIEKKMSYQAFRYASAQ